MVCLCVCVNAWPILRSVPDVASLGRVNARTDQHHWMELTLQPSQLSFVCDPSYDEPALDTPAMPDGALSALTTLPWSSRAASDGMTTVPLTLAYTPGHSGKKTGLYPNGRPLAFCRPQLY